MEYPKAALNASYKEKYISVLTEYLSSLRAKVGVTQEELSKIIGVSRQTYYAIENRCREMSWSMYMTLIMFFDTNEKTHDMLRNIGAYPDELMALIKQK